MTDTQAAHYLVGLWLKMDSSSQVTGGSLSCWNYEVIEWDRARDDKGLVWELGEPVPSSRLGFPHAAGVASLLAGLCALTRSSDRRL